MSRPPAELVADLQGKLAGQGLDGKLAELAGAIEAQALERALAEEQLADLLGGHDDARDELGPPVQVALAAAAGAVHAVGKERRVESAAGGYAYRSVDDVYDAVHEAFATHGVIPLPDVLDRTVAVVTDVSSSGKPERHVTVTVRLRFVGPRGDELAAVTYGEGLDRRDRATQKAITDAFKYGLLRVLTIPLTDDASDEGAADPRRPEVEELAEFIAAALAADLPAERVAAGTAYAAESRANLAAARKGIAAEAAKIKAAGVGVDGDQGAGVEEAAKPPGGHRRDLGGKNYGKLTAYGVDEATRRVIARAVTRAHRGDDDAVSSTGELEPLERADVMKVAEAIYCSLVVLVGEAKPTLETAAGAAVTLEQVRKMNTERAREALRKDTTR